MGNDALLSQQTHMRRRSEPEPQGSPIARNGPGRRRRGGWTAVLLVAGTLSIVAISAQPDRASAAPIVPISVTITSITQPDDSIDPGVFQGPWGDFYAGVTITGTKLDNFSHHLTNGFELGVGYLFPATFNVKASEWTLSKDVDAASGPVSVSIEIWDNDDCDDPFCSDAGFEHRV